MGAYGINIIGLSSNKAHEFHYEIGEAFFRQYGTDLVSKGDFVADVALNKHETFIEADFAIMGAATLICDRTLEPFEHPIKGKHKILFKFGDANQELSDEIVMIHRDTATLEIGQYIYEFIALAVPMKKLHPSVRAVEEDDENTAGKIVYSSDAGDNDDNTDPRWDILKNLK